MRTVNELENSEKILIGILTIIALGAIIYFLVAPSIRDINNYKEQISQEQQKLDEFKDTEKKNASKRVKLAKLKKDYSDSEKIIPRDERNPEITINVNEICSSKKVELQGLNFGPPAKFSAAQAKEKNNSTKDVLKDSLVSVPVNMTVKGEFLDIVNYINALETDKRMALVQTVNLTKDDKGVITGNLQANYYYVDTSKTSNDKNGLGKEDLQYDFDNGTATGKDDLFK
ncbi:MAG: hypothetical protein Q8936_00965 [Bacillota bacterium]|nr:hypothetical protein [Bacillota bacterium]